MENIEKELRRSGYNPQWFIISQKRMELYNNLLPNSRKNGKSKHLKGKAIDIFVMDVDGDGKYDIKDYDLIKSASEKLAQQIPSTRGGVFNYLGKGYFTRHMVHVELSE